MKPQHISGIARPLDFTYPGNLWIALSTGLTCAAVLLWNGVAGDGTGGSIGGDWISATGVAAQAGLAVFLAWAICRELEPDRAAAAVLASLLAMGAIVLVGLPRTGACLVVLIAVRVLNRTTGVAATPLDMTVLLGLGVWAALDAGWAYFATAAAALLGDALLSPRRLYRLALVLASVAAAIGLLLLLGAPDVRLVGSSRLMAVAMALLLSLLLLLTIGAATEVQSVGDITGQPLNPVRVGAGQVLALGLGVLAALESGFVGLSALVPLWSAVAAAGLYRLLSRLTPMHW